MSRVIRELISFLVHFDSEVDYFSLELFAFLNHIQKGQRTTQVSPQLQHFFVGSLIIFPMFTGLHLFGSAPKGDIRIATGTGSTEFFRLHLWNQRIELNGQVKYRQIFNKMAFSRKVDKERNLPSLDVCLANNRTLQLCNHYLVSIMILPH